MKKTALLVAGAIVTFVGAIVFISPIPFGFAILIPGLAMLIMGSDTVARWFKHRREAHDKLDDKMEEAQEKAPDEMNEPLERTDPDSDQCVEDKKQC